MPLYPTVLVVDDSATERAFVGALLSKDPFIQVDYAGSGMEAVQKMGESAAQVVVTDLIMPEMNGMELVRELTRRHLLAPIILMTAQGNGAIGVEALQQGAACYIPKAQLRERLVGTIYRLLGTVSGRHNYERILDCQLSVERHFALENKRSQIQSVVGLVNETTASMRFCDARTRVQIAVAVEEALLNALYHGNLEIDLEELRSADEVTAFELIESRRRESPFRERRIDFQFRIDRQVARFQIRDEGTGFDTSMMQLNLDPSSLETTGSHGLVMIGTFMDEVVYNETGNAVELVKHNTAEQL